MPALPAAVPPIRSLWFRLACAVGATLCGAVLLLVIGAPFRYAALNIASLGLGLVVLPALRRRGARAQGTFVALLPLLLGSVLVATALWGFSIDGVHRWWRVGGLSLHAGLVLLPALLVWHAQRPTGASTFGVGLAALATALQPDRGTAWAVLAGTVLLAAARRDRGALGLTLFAGACVVVSLLRPDTLPAAPFVEGIGGAALAGPLLAGVVLVAGWLAMLAPALPAFRPDTRRRLAYGVFGIVWLALVVASLLGNYPMPLLGYGGSAILGYALSLGLLPDGG